MAMFTPSASARVRVLDVDERRKFQHWLAMAERRDNPMILTVFRRRQPEATIRALYGTIVAQARHPSFYLSYGVPDTTTGRFEMIVLHQTLLLRRLRLAGAPDHRRPLGQAVFDFFCRDMDHNLREMGVGDLAVPKEMRRIGEAFYGRATAYDRALDTADEEALVVALARNVLGEATIVPDGARRLARYVWEAMRQLAATSEASLAQALLAFPDPDTITAPGGVSKQGSHAMSNPERSLQAPWSIPVRLDDVPETGLHIELAADSHVRDAIAALAGLRAVPRLQAVFDLSRRGHNGLRVIGQVSATVGQTCVVSLDPIENTVEEAVDLVFARPGPGADVEDIAAVIDALPEEGPEPLVNGTVDLGAIAIEFLLLGLDPYPRKPGVVFAPPPPQETTAGPFSGLAALKVGRKSDGSN